MTTTYTIGQKVKAINAIELGRELGHVRRGQVGTVTNVYDLGEDVVEVEWLGGVRVSVLAASEMHRDIKPYHSYRVARWSAVALLAVLCFVGPQVVEAVTEPAFEVLDTQLEANTVMENGALVLRSTARLNRACPTRLERSIAKQDGTVVWFTALDGAGSAREAVREIKTIRVQVQLPHGLRPGAYTYSSVYHSLCNDGRETAQMARNIPFSVTPIQ